MSSSNRNANVRIYEPGTILKTIKNIWLYKNHDSKQTVDVPKETLLTFLDYIYKGETNATIRRYYYQDMILEDSDLTKYKPYQCFKVIENE